MSDAILRAESWWQATEVRRVYPNGETVTDFLGGLARHQLGRKQLLGTLLAATLHHSGIQRIISNNERDYRILGGLEVVPFR